MRLPELTKLNVSKHTINIFRGYNHNLKIGEGEFYHTENITSDFFPFISPRKPRGTHIDGINPLGMINKDGLCYVDGESIVIGGHKINLALSTEKDKCPKRLLSMGAYIVIFPDKKYINSVNFNDRGTLEANWSSAENTVKFMLSRADGENFGKVTVSDEEPEAPENLKYWLDTSGEVHVLKQYSDYSKTWVVINTTYIRMESEGIGKCFSEGDCVSISGITEESVSKLNGSAKIQSLGDNYIVVTGILKQIVETTENITIKRITPDMDFVIEHENRLWGCRYGLNNNGEFVNEIYASKLGDFKNWNCFDGISTDSYVVSVGTGGKFTGAISYSGYPLFFKEGFIHKILGYSPSTFQLNTTQCNGVEDGSGDSLVVINGILYYKSASSVCSFGGGMPEEISQPLGKKAYRRAKAGGYNGKYYISMQDIEFIKSWSEPVVTEGALFLSQVITAETEEVSGGNRLNLNVWSLPLVEGGKMTLTQLYDSVKTYEISLGIKKVEDFSNYREKVAGAVIIPDTREEDSWNLFVFDTAKGIWAREDNLRVDAFCSSGNETYFVKHRDTAIRTLSGKGEKEEREVRWALETGDIGTDTPNKKYVSRINARLLLDVGSVVTFSVQYDSSGEWIRLQSISGERLKSVDFPVKIRRCDHFKMKIEGIGPCKIYSITKSIEKGSNV